MTRLFVAAFLAAGLLGGWSVGRAGPPQEPRFELLSAAVAINADGSPREDGEERCLFGRHDPGVPVLLLSDTDSKSCQVETGRVGAHFMDGECTVLVGMERCTGRYSLGVIGSRGLYQRVEPQPVKDGPARAALSRAISQGRVVEAATVRWKRALGALSYDATIVEALSWAGLPGAPALVRLKVNGGRVEGPWVAISSGEAGTMVGPFSSHSPGAFILDGKGYLSIETADCTDCGAVATEVHAVEAGKLRRVLRSTANAT